MTKCKLRYRALLKDAVDTESCLESKTGGEIQGSTALCLACFYIVPVYLQLEAGCQDRQTIRSDRRLTWVEIELTDQLRKYLSLEYTETQQRFSEVRLYCLLEE